MIAVNLLSNCYFIWQLIVSNVPHDLFFFKTEAKVANFMWLFNLFID